MILPINNHIPKEPEKSVFRLERKLPRIDDSRLRKLVRINAIRTNLRSSIIGALAKPKSRFFRFFGYKLRAILLFLCATLSIHSEEISQTTHETTLNGQSIVYTATVGSIPARDSEGKESGKIFYIAYRREGVSDPAERPITFAFNGGPGSSSVWLHLGALGPKRVLSFEEGQTAAPSYVWIDNADSILDLTDLVFIDPIGTGFSRPSKEGEDSFYNIDGDISAVGDFIRDFVTMEGRWRSPKYVAGESYGTLRACGVAEYLLSRHGLYLNGLILISCAIDFQTLVFSLDNELPYSLFLPSFAATAWYHGKMPNMSLEDAVNGARAFAEETFAPALLRLGRVPPQLYSGIASWTGLPEELIGQHDGLIDDETFFLQLLKQEKKVVGRFDSRLTGSILVQGGYKDPCFTKVQGIFTAAMHAYLLEELHCKADWPRYEVLADLPWDLKSFGYPNLMGRLRQALVHNPELAIFVACGYFDLATPFAATEYCFKRLHLPLDRNVTFGYYEGGHMFYIHPASLKQFKSDLMAFYGGRK
jgi:carboxypeptidase C (cathepsin A)